MVAAHHPAAHTAHHPAARHPAAHGRTFRPDGYQPSLFGGDEPGVDETFGGLRRTWLDDESWIDHLPRWLRGADVVFDELLTVLPWAQRDVVMYDRVVAEPRLTAWWDTNHPSPAPSPVLDRARRVLTDRYRRPFDSIGFNLYRDGRDSVAWHADRERFELENPVVVIVSVGSPRAFQVRPRRDPFAGHVPATATAHTMPSWLLGHGDLLVMGGACQHHWEHRVPKTAHADGPRLSIMFRHHLAGEPTGSGSHRRWGAARDWER
jgi:alkylated DNA repair dioxygenase AlkB